MNFIEF